MTNVLKQNRLDVLEVLALKKKPASHMAALHGGDSPITRILDYVRPEARAVSPSRHVFLSLTQSTKDCIVLKLKIDNSPILLFLLRLVCEASSYKFEFFNLKKM